MNKETANEEEIGIEDSSTIEVDETAEIEQIELCTRHAGREDDSRRHSTAELDEMLDIESYAPDAWGDSPATHLGWPLVPEQKDECSPILDTLADGAFDDGESGQPSTESILQRPDGEPQQLRLAVEIAELRRQAAARELALEAQLAAARRLLESQELELADHAAQVASLTLECSGLRADLEGSPRRRISRSFGTPEGPMVAVGLLGTHKVHDDRDTVQRLKERLEERSRVIDIARKEADELRVECLRLRAASSYRPAEGGARWNLRRLFSRILGDATASEAVPVQAASAQDLPDVADAYAGAAGAEVATLAIEPEAAPAAAVDPPVAAARDAERKRVLERVRLERRRQMVEYAGAERRRGVADRPALRRYLIALDPARSEVHEITRSRMYVGRGAEADLRLGDATVSRLHSVISVENGATVVEDTCSSNGVFVNSQRIRRLVLRDGDRLTFGTVGYQYRIGPTPPQTD
jgi:hypothetical protein